MTTDEKVKELIANVLNVSVDEVTDNTEIGELEEWDSLHNVQILVALEEEFRIKMTPDLLMDLETVEDIVDLIEELKA